MTFKVFAMLLLATTVLTATAAAAPPAAFRSELVPSITVVGTGEVQAKPDTAQINVGVMTEGATAAEAVRGNNEAMAQLLETLKQQGIEERHIQTSGFNVSPKYQYRRDDGRPPEIVGYTVSNQVQVTVRDLLSLGTVLDKVVQAGANQIHGISFSVHNPQQQMDEARRKAVAEARRKAKLYADAAGVKLGKPLMIEEVQPSGGPEPLYRPRMAAAEMAQAVPIATGEQTISAVITVTYALEDEANENE